MPSQGRPRHTRRDANHSDIVAQCIALGMVVWDLADLGGNISDILVIWRGRCVPVEIKPPGKRDQLTKGERDGLEECAYVGVDWVIATDVDDVLEAFGAKWEEL